MAEDPAITKAKRLIAAKQSKAAVLLLFQRIEYLNQELARLAMQPQSALPRRRVSGWAIFTVVFLIVVIVGGILFAIVLNHNSDQRVENATERMEAELNLERICAYAAADEPALDCEQWVEDTLDAHQDTAIDCTHTFGQDESAVSNCLAGKGVPLP